MERTDNQEMMISAPAKLMNPAKEIQGEIKFAVRDWKDYEHVSIMTMRWIYHFHLFGNHWQRFV